MRVWRVAHRTALDTGFPSGPYTGCGVGTKEAERLWDMAGAHSNLTHPSPQADPKLQGMGDYERCGFDSLDALNAWFEGWGEALSECGFQVWEYEVPDWAVRVGAYGQALFHAEEAVEISAYEFTYSQPALFA